eukprot:gene19629-26313_t
MYFLVEPVHAYVREVRSRLHAKPGTRLYDNYGKDELTSPTILYAMFVTGMPSRIQLRQPLQLKWQQAGKSRVVVIHRIVFEPPVEIQLRQVAAQANYRFSAALAVTKMVSMSELSLHLLERLLHEVPSSVFNSHQGGEPIFDASTKLSSNRIDMNADNV